MGLFGLALMQYLLLNARDTRNAFINTASKFNVVSDVEMLI